MLSIAEELLLLAFDDAKGTVAFPASSSLDYGLVGGGFGRTDNEGTACSQR